MADNKSINFTFTVDSQSLNRIKTAIRDIQADLAKLVNTANSLNLGGGRGGITMGGGGPTMPQGAATAMARQGGAGGQGGGGLADTFIQAGKAMKDMSGISKDALRAMSDSVRSSMDSQKRDVKSLGAEIDAVTQRYSTLQSKTQAYGGGGQGGGTTLYGGGQGGGTMLYGGGQGGAAQLPPPGAPPGGGGFFGVPSWMSNPRGVMQAAGLGGVAALAGPAAIGMGAKLAYNTALAGPTEFSSAAATRGQMAYNRQSRILGGDYSDFLASRQLADSQKVRDLQAVMGAGRTGGFATQMMGGGLGAFSGAAGLAGDYMSGRATWTDTTGAVAQAFSRGMKGVGQFVTGGGISGLTDTGQETIKAQAAEKQIEEMKFHDSTLKLGLEQWQSNRAGSQSAQRVMGIRGLGVRNARGETTYDFNDMETRLKAAGYEPGQEVSAFAGLRAGAGTQFAWQHRGEAMRAEAGGYGGYSALLAASGRESGGVDAARRAISGGLDPTAGMTLGQGIIGTGYDPLGTVSSAPLIEAIQLGMGFTGGVGDFNKTQMALAGVALNDKVVGGTLDAYQAARNLASAIQIKPGADVYTQDYLATGMNMKQMVAAARGEGVTQEAFELGIGTTDVRAQLDASTSSILQERRPGAFGNRVAKAVGAFQESGLSLSDYYAGLDDKARSRAVSSLGIAYGQATGVGASAGIGAQAALAGLSLDVTAGLQRGLGGGVTGAEAEANKAQAEAIKQLGEAVKAAAGKGGLLDFLKKQGEDFARTGAFGDNLVAQSDLFVEGVMHMNVALKKMGFISQDIPPSGQATAPKKK